MTSFDVLVVGAGHGGAQAAVALRQNEFAGTIGIVGAEPELPYERPPLSKEYLAGRKPFDRMLIRPADFWSARGVTLLLGKTVVAVDPEHRKVRLHQGGSISYRHLIWAAGGAPRRLNCSGSDLAHVHLVRTRRDVDAIISRLAAARRVVVIGGGYIGLETAAILTELGKKVIVLEAMDRVLARVAGEPISRFFESEHRAHGVEVRTGIAVDCIVGEDGTASGVKISGGELLAADMVIVGVGIVPAVEPLLAAGAAGGNGVDVDHYCRTSLRGIYAVGDCAAHENRFANGARVRLESVQNANDQAVVAAKAIAGTAEPYAAVPWFWSDQYDAKLQTVGLAAGHDDLVVRGDPADRSFSVIYLRAGRVIALDCVNATRDYVQGRKLVLDGTRLDKASLADGRVPIKALAT